MAYAIVYDEYFRDENLCQRMGGFNIPSSSDDAPYWPDPDGRYYIKPSMYASPKGSNGIKLFFNDIANQTSISGQYKYSSWKKDYFTSALPWQQRGTSPNVPLSFSEFSSYLAPSFSTNFSAQTIYSNNTALSSTYDLNSQYNFLATASQNVRFIIGSTSGFWTGSVLDKNTGTTYDNAKLVFNRVTAYNAGTKTITGNAIIYFSNQIVELGSVSVIFTLDTITSSVSDVSDFRPDTNILASSSSEASVDINNIRLAYQIQLFLERNSRSGVRYTEFLKSHFSMFPRDERLQRPEFIGGSTSGLYVSEVLQTSQTSTTPQGNLAGKGIIADSGYIGSYQATEFGVLIGFQYIKPKGAYHQGLDRQWLRKTRYDYYFPEFAHLSEQAILTSEIMLSDSDEANSKVFGFQGRYDEMRRKFDRVNGALRPDQNLEYWTLARNFSTPPSLNSAFVTLNSDEANGGFSKRVFAVTDERPFICNLGFNIQAMRPMPITSDPGYSDHPYMY